MKAKVEYEHATSMPCFLKLGFETEKQPFQL